VSGTYVDPSCLGQKGAALLRDETAQGRGMDEVGGTGCGAGPERAEYSGILH
jgi:hypothetical protein